MDQIFFSLMNGIIYGLLLFMVSAGLTLIFGMMGILNFAHASFYMLGAYFAYALQGPLGFWGRSSPRPCWWAWWELSWSAISCVGFITMAMRMSCSSPSACLDRKSTRLNSRH